MIKRIVFALIAMVFVSQACAQELNATVQILDPTRQVTNQELIPNMKKAIENLLNFTVWTTETYEVEERIRCSFVITLSARNGNNFSGNIQVNYSRPIYNSNYDSPVLNYIDTDFDFTFLENEPLEYIQNANSGNLTAVLSFYAYVIIGLDKDTYSFQGGQQAYTTAQGIVSMAQSEGAQGWRSFDGNRNRFWMIDNLLNTGFSDMRFCLYNYHRMGMDLMYKVDAQRAAKEKISNSLISLKNVYEKRPNAFILQLFFDAKSNEIVDVFSKGPNVETTTLIATLKKIDAGRSSKYESIGR